MINKKDSSWIFLESSHILLDLLNNELTKAIEKSTDQPKEFIYDIKNSIFKVQIPVDSINCFETYGLTNEMHVEDANSDVEDILIGSGDQDLNKISDILESKALQIAI